MNEPRRSLCLLLGGCVAWAAAGSTAAQVPGPMASSRPPPAAPPSASGTGTVAPPPFRVGERLEYDLYVRGHRAGRAVLAVEGREAVGGTPAYRVSLEVEGGPFFFRIDDRKVSWIALRPFRSLRFLEHLREGSGESRRTVDLDHEAGTFVERRPDAGGEASSRTGPLADAAVDELAFFYLLRVLTLEDGETLVLHRFYEAGDNPIVVGVEGRREVKTPGGSFRAVVVRPVLPAVGALSKDARAEVLLSDDERRIVVQVRSRTALGDVVLRLRDYRAGVVGESSGRGGREATRSEP